MTQHLPLILVELVLVFGGALAFAWWQLRDLDREKRRREQGRHAAPASRPSDEPAERRDAA